MPSGHIVERNGSFRVMVYVGRDPLTGRKRQITRTVRGSRKDAERVRNELLVEVQQRTASPSAVTFSHLLDAWYETASPDWSPRTALEHRRIIESVLKPALGRKKVANLRASDLDALYGALRGDPTDGSRSRPPRSASSTPWPALRCSRPSGGSGSAPTRLRTRPRRRDAARSPPRRRPPTCPASSTPHRRPIPTSTCSYGWRRSSGLVAARCWASAGSTSPMTSAASRSTRRS